MAKTSKSVSKAPANAMDYPEHEKTYDIFLWISKWTIAFCIALLVAMMVGFPLEGGFIGGLLTFIILMIASFFYIKK